MIQLKAVSIMISGVAIAVAVAAAIATLVVRPLRARYKLFQVRREGLRVELRYGYPWLDQIVDGLDVEVLDDGTNCHVIWGPDLNLVLERLDPTTWEARGWRH